MSDSESVDNSLAESTDEKSPKKTPVSSSKVPVSSKRATVRSALKIKVFNQVKHTFRLSSCMVDLAFIVNCQRSSANSSLTF